LPVNGLRRRKAANSESDTPIKQSTIHKGAVVLPAPLAPEKAHHLAWLNLKRHDLLRSHITGAASHEMPKRSGQTELLLNNPVGFTQPLNTDQSSTWLEGFRKLTIERLILRCDRESNDRLNHQQVIE
jgi:hypothetical protein